MKTNQPIIILALLCGQSSLSASIPTFTRIATGAIATDEGVSTGCAWGDYNNDGYEDLFVACSQPGAQNLLYSNNRDGSFTSISNGSVVTDGGNSAACIWGDFDNDGFLDLFVTQTLESGNRLYRNHGDGTFSPVEEGSVVTDRGSSRNCAWADYDNDGFLDLFVANFDDYGESPPQPNFLYRNDGNSNHWIKIKLVGTVSNRAGIGAKIRVKANLGANCPVATPVTQGSAADGATLG